MRWPPTSSVFFDGVTSRGAVDEKLNIGGATPGRWVARTLGAALATLHPDAAAPEALARLRRALAQGLEGDGVEPEHWQWSAATQTAVFSHSRRELWGLGDTMLSVNGEVIPDPPTPLDGPAVGYRADAL